MLQTALSDKKGMTLVEVLIALVVLLLVSLAMLQTALVGIDANMINVLRDEAVSITEVRMKEARNVPFASLPSSGTNIEPTGPNLYTTYGGPVPIPACVNPPVNDPNPYPVLVQRDIRSIPAFPFGTRLTVTALGADDRRIDILVRWQYRNECYSHQISTIIRRTS